MAQFVTSPLVQLVDENGTPYAGAKLYIYETNTTTLLNLFSDEAMTTPAANPAIADGMGLFPNLYIVEKRFKAVIYDADNVLIKSVDPAYSTADTSLFSAIDMTYDGTASGLTSTNVQGAIDELAEYIDDVSGNAGGLASSKADKTITITGTGLATGGGSLEANREINVKAATAAEAKAMTLNTVVITPKGLGDALNGGNQASQGWCTFTGEGTPSIVASFNVATVVRTGTGRYTLTWSTPFASANYTVVASGSSSVIIGAYDKTPTSVKLRGTGNNSDSDRDTGFIDVIAFGARA